MLTVLVDELVGTLDRIADLVGGERFDPDQPRDTKGRWTDIPGVSELIDAARDVAAKLNKGKKLDENDPTEATLARAIEGWARGGGLKAEVTRAIREDPTGHSAGAQFARAVAAAPADAPQLYRGMAHVAPEEIPAEGDTFDLEPTSFTRDRAMAERFSTPDHMAADRFIVRTRVAKGSRALRIDQHAAGFEFEREHVGMGRYRVTRRRERTEKVGGQLRRIVELDIEQVERPEGDPTFTRHGANAEGMNFDYGMFN